MMKTRIVVLLLAAVAGPAPAGTLSLSGGEYAITSGGVVAGGSIVSGGIVGHSYTLGGPSGPMSGGSYSLSPGSLAASRPAALELGAAHAFPTLYKPSLGHDRITFTALTPRATVDVFTLTGQRVRRFEKTDGSDKIVWTPVVNEQGQPLASGIYLFVVWEKGLKSKQGKIMVIR
jgi:hypothetical protein